MDLIHFTILRPPYKQDATPIRELALISFPVRELFEERLEEFDLVVFDRYARRGVIPQLYLANGRRLCARRRRASRCRRPRIRLEGHDAPRIGAERCLSGGPDGQDPHGSVPSRVPTAVGRRHPVTGPLAAGSAEPRWGRWLRQVDVEPARGQTLLSGAEGRPLLLVARIGEGRVGLLASDQVWLWARGYQGGGPHAELLRRLAHWLMKEPDLEEDALIAGIVGGRLEVERRKAEADPEAGDRACAGRGARSMSSSGPPAPGAGRARSRPTLSASGRCRRDRRRPLQARPSAIRWNSRTCARRRPGSRRSRRPRAGRVLWLGQDDVPELRKVRPGGRMTGRGWLGLRDNRAYRVTGIERTPPAAGLAGAGVGGAAARLALAARGAAGIGGKSGIRGGGSAGRRPCGP